MRKLRPAMLGLMVIGLAARGEVLAQDVSTMPNIGDGTSLPVELVEGRAVVIIPHKDVSAADAGKKIPSVGAAAMPKRPVGSRPGASAVVSEQLARPVIGARPVVPCVGKASSNATSARALVAKIAGEEGGDAKLADAVAAQESGFDQSLVSPKGAIGVMQLMPGTAQRYRVDACDVEQNIRGGVRYLRDLSEEFGGNVMLVLAAYNAGPERVYAAKGVPASIETVRYVASVSNNYFGFENALSTARTRASTPGAGSPAAEPATTMAEADASNRWIGGSVLYVEQRGAEK